MNEGKLPPHNIAAEEAVNGSLLIDGQAIHDISILLKPEDFYSEQNKLIYQACCSLDKRSEAINEITVAQELVRQEKLEQSGGTAYLSHLIAEVPTSLDIKHFAQIVYRLSISRQLISAADKISNIGYLADPDIAASLSRAEDVLFRLRHERPSFDFVHISNVLDDYFKVPSSPEAEGYQPIPHALSGLTGLDDILGGFQRSDLVIVAGRPTMGKTSLALNIARNVAVLQKGCVAVFSLEMSGDALAQRLVSSEARVNSQHIRMGHHTKDIEGRIMEAQGILSETQIYIDDFPQLRVSEMRSKARRLYNERGGIDLIIIDYLQLMQGDGYGRENRVQEISYISRSLKALARDLNVPVIAVSQLSRAPEQRHTHIPQLSDLRESGSIEQDADIVIMVYRDEVQFETEKKWLEEHPEEEYPKGLADIIIRKNRNGPCGWIKVRFKEHLTKFENLETEIESSQLKMEPSQL